MVQLIALTLLSIGQNSLVWGCYFAGISLATLFFILYVFRYKWIANDHTLSFSRPFNVRRVNLKTLCTVEARLVGAGTKRPSWKLIVIDRSGASVVMNLTGYRANEREELMSYMSPYLTQEGVDKIGEVDFVISANPWFPSTSHFAESN
jgi:hypothetical protein